MKKALHNVVLSGIQPSGFIHLGNYLGAVQNWVQLQEQPNIHQRFYTVVDYHSITQSYVGAHLPEEDDGEPLEFQSGPSP